MKKFITLGCVIALTVFASDSFAQSNNTNKNIRVSGNINRNPDGCFVITDNCSGVRYGLDGDYSFYDDGASHCIIGKFTTASPPCSPALSVVLDVKNISDGDCANGSNCP